MNALDVVVLVGGRRRGLRRVPPRLRGPGAVVARAVDRARRRPPAHPAPRALAHRQHARRPAARRRVAPHRPRADRAHDRPGREPDDPHARYSLPEHVGAVRPRHRRAPRRARRARAPVAAVPALRSTPGWPAREARDSSLVAALDRFAPDQPPSARIVGRIVGEAPYPLFDDARVDERPPTTDAGPRVDTVGARSVVLVAGRGVRPPAVGHRLRGRARPRRDQRARRRGGADAPRSSPSTATRRDARVVRFDGRHDIAILRGRRPAAAGRSPSGRPRSGPSRSVLGHPDGGHLRATPARIVRRIDRPRHRHLPQRHDPDVDRRARRAPHRGRLRRAASSTRRGGARRWCSPSTPADADTAFALSSDELAPFVARRSAATTPSRPAPASSTDRLRRSASGVEPSEVEKPNQDGRSRRTRPAASTETTTTQMARTP